MHPPDPVVGLQAAFERIAATRMHGLPMRNPALRVATIGFRCWEEAFVGVLVTPWAINLVAVSTDAEALRLATDVRQKWEFPSGSYELMGGMEPECGCFQCCSLFSPAFEFTDQAAAEDTAKAMALALFEAANSDRREAARLSGNSVLQAQTSRRGFLRSVLAVAKV